MFIRITSCFMLAVLSACAQTSHPPIHAGTGLALLTLGSASAYQGKVAEYSADMVMLEGGRVMETLKLHVSWKKVRVDGLTAGPLGRIAPITRKDIGVVWTLYLDKHEYTEKPLAAGRRTQPDLAGFDFSGYKREHLGRETVFGYPCTKMRIALGNLPNGRPMDAIVWVADGLELPLRLETMGITQENRNLRVGPQPPSLFEIPAGFVKSRAPGMSTGMTPPPAPRYEGAYSESDSGMEMNTNRMGGDYRDFDLGRPDPAACKSACDDAAKCQAWTYVKPGGPGERAHCWLKEVAMPANREECCISGVKGAGGVASGDRRLPGAPRALDYRPEHNVNRNGEDYRDFTPARAEPFLCAEACAKESRCKAWTWVKPDPGAPTGSCWLKHSVPEASPDECCISGVKN